jgi:hypothetical protein
MKKYRNCVRALYKLPTATELVALEDGEEEEEEENEQGEQGEQGEQEQMQAEMTWGAHHIVLQLTTYMVIVYALQ